MVIRYPNYYRKFQCIAGECPDTCCAGWEIPVDRVSEKRYQDARKQGEIKNRDFARKLKEYIKNGHIISDDVTCPFLDSEGLCEMYKELGPESLCHTCKRHPRHMEDYGDLHEIVLLLSCPEVARLVLEANEGGFYERNLPERHGNLEGIDGDFLKVLLEMREILWKVAGAKESKLSPGERMAFAVALAHDLQRRIYKDSGDYEGMKSVLARYASAGAAERFIVRWKCSDKNIKEKPADENQLASARFTLMADFMEELAGLDTICRGWPQMLEMCRVKLYHSVDSRVEYLKKRRNMQKMYPEAEKEFKNIFEYFTYSFVLPALYDGDVLTKVKMAVLCTMAVEELYMAAGTPNVTGQSSMEEQLTMTGKIDICHALARQIENSDENRAALEHALKQETFGARRILDALIGCS